MPDVMTVRQTVERAQADGLPVTEYTLRRWIKEGRIPVCRAGTKQLVFYPNLVSFVTCTPQSPA